MRFFDPGTERVVMREICGECGLRDGYVQMKGRTAVVYCVNDHWVYNAPQSQLRQRTFHWGRKGDPCSTCRERATFVTAAGRPLCETCRAAEMAHPELTGPAWDRWSLR